MINISGGTIKLFVNILHIEKKVDENVSLTEEINRKLFEHVMAGIEIVCGKHGEYYAQSWFKQIDKKYLKKMFCVKDYDHTMKKIYEEVTLADHFLHLYGPSLISKDNLNNNNQPASASQSERKVGVLESNGAMYSKLSSDMLDLEMQSNDSKTGTPRLRVTRQKSVNDPERDSLKRALKNDPIKKLHQVYDKNLVNAHHRDVNLHLKKRRESALWLKEKIITINEDGTMTKQIKPEDLPLLNQKLESMREEERFDVNIMLQQHHEIRKRKSKSAGSIRSNSAVSRQRPFLVNEVSMSPPISERDEWDFDHQQGTI